MQQIVHFPLVLFVAVLSLKMSSCREREKGEPFADTGHRGDQPGQPSGGAVPEDDLQRLQTGKSAPEVPGGLKQ